MAFSPDGQKAFAWDSAGQVLAWDTTTGQPTAADNPPARPAPGPAISPDGGFTAQPDGNRVRLVDRLNPPVNQPWPLPDAGERKRYHAEQAERAEQQKQWFVVSFHLRGCCWTTRTTSS